MTKNLPGLDFDQAETDMAISKCAKQTKLGSEEADAHPKRHPAVMIF